jgi:hypothetical protein
LACGLQWVACVRPSLRRSAESLRNPLKEKL